MVAEAVNHLGFKVGYNHYVLILTVDLHNIVLVGADPRPQNPAREVGSQGILFCGGTALAADRPGVDLISAANNTVITGSGVYLCVVGR